MNNYSTVYEYHVRCKIVDGLEPTLAPSISTVLESRALRWRTSGISTPLLQVNLSGSSFN